MAFSVKESQEQLIQRLTAGFGALLEQVQELARKNIELEERLTRVRQEAIHLSRSDSPLSRPHSPDQRYTREAGNLGQQSDGSPSASGEAQETDSMCSEDRTKAITIADGVEAWKEITDGKGPVWRKWNQDKLDAQQSREIVETKDPQQKSLPAGHPAVDPHGTDNICCPFAGMSQLGRSQNTKVEESSTQRPGSLPTPPPTQGHFIDTAVPGGSRTGNMSPPPSGSGSVSKCPIRMLDERSPEEIAEYFEIHKHEIPRSHEICVKRYQSNAQSIRQLDAKYGTLVNMIQGLGMKHQPLLPAQEDEDDFTKIDSKSIKKVRKWAEHVQKIPEFVEADVNPLDRDDLGRASQSSEVDPSDEDARDGQFDRSLKEIRVGESPSRPWGISVPLAAVSTSQPHDREDVPLRENGPASGQTGAKLIGSHGTEAQMEEKPKMIFTGPVFIGYSPEQAAALIKKCGWDPQGPQGPKL